MTRVKEMRLSETGLTEEQQACFRLGHCTGPEQHRWVGPNFPTPEGECPFCIDPQVLADFRAVQVDLLAKEAALPKREAVDIPPVAPFQIPPPIANMIKKRKRKTRMQQLKLWGVPESEPHSPEKEA